ncbi:MAG: DUF3843 family protein, partial [Planctomycetota bacterium]|nr:DUF3843 family protein [Planctomycetota bacterium]
MAYAVHRPQGFRGKGDSHLPEFVRQLRGRLADVQRDFTYATLRLRPKSLGELAGILVDFAEDLHNNAGIWAAYERYNGEFFGTALPLTSDHTNPGTDFHPDRFRHLLWVLYPVLIDGLVLSPTHQDLQRVAEASSQFLSDAFSDIPEDSGVAVFLGTPGVHGWDVKRKLIWLGTHSYMFRLPFARYMAAQSSGRTDIGH